MSAAVREQFLARGIAVELPRGDRGAGRRRLAELHAGEEAHRRRVNRVSVNARGRLFRIRKQEVKGFGDNQAGPGPVQSGAVKRTRRSGGSGGAKFSDHISEDTAIAAASGGAPIAPVDALIAIQEVADATTGRRSAILRGRTMLDLLDDVRLGLLEGTIPASRLIALADTVRGKRDEVSDPRLAEVLDEIELRAAFEAAKVQLDR